MLKIPKKMGVGDLSKNQGNQTPASGLLPWKNAFFKGGSFVKLAAEGVLMYFAIRNCQYISAKNN